MRGGLRITFYRLFNVGEPGVPTGLFRHVTGPAGSFAERFDRKTGDWAHDRHLGAYLFNGEPGAEPVTAKEATRLAGMLELAAAHRHPERLCVRPSIGTSLPMSLPADMSMTSMPQRLPPEHRASVEEIVADRGEQWVRDHLGLIVDQIEYVDTL